MLMSINASPPIFIQATPMRTIMYDNDCSLRFLVYKRNFWTHVSANFKTFVFLNICNMYE